MPIPHRSSRPVDPVEEQPPVETEEVEVLELELTFTGGHMLPLRIFPEDEFYNTSESPTMSVKFASGAVTVIHKEHLLYESSRRHTFKRVKKPATPLANFA